MEMNSIVNEAMNNREMLALRHGGKLKILQKPYVIE